jgi:hypothetical protein
MDSDSALRALAAIAQGSLTLAGLMLVATTFYLARSKKSYSMMVGNSKATRGEKAVNLVIWSFVIVGPVAVGLSTAYGALQLMLTVPSNVVLSDDMAIQVKNTLRNFSYLLAYVVIDSVLFVLVLPILEPMRQKKPKQEGDVHKKKRDAND